MILKTTNETLVWKPPSARTIRVVHELLLARYGSKTARKRDPLDGIIVIMLSQATNDLNCDRAFSSLKQTFPSWTGVLQAPVEEIADAIRMGGLANQKAARIKLLLQEIYDEQGNLDLSWMHAASSEKCREFMARFKGVGPKTIACVLVFFLDKPAFPVDTHVHRVTKRLSWIREKAGAGEAHRVLESAIPDDCKLNLHVNIIQHGRTICRAAGERRAALFRMRFDSSLRICPCAFGAESDSRGAGREYSRAGTCGFFRDGGVKRRMNSQPEKIVGLRRQLRLQRQRRVPACGRNDFFLLRIHSPGILTPPHNPNPRHTFLSKQAAQ